MQRRLRACSRPDEDHYFYVGRLFYALRHITDAALRELEWAKQAAAWAPLSGTEEQTARAISAHAQYACLLSLQMGSIN